MIPNGLTVVGVVNLWFLMDDTSIEVNDGELCV
jgi:hypothetical protein